MLRRYENFLLTLKNNLNPKYAHIRIWEFLMEIVTSIYAKIRI